MSYYPGAVRNGNRGTTKSSPATQPHDGSMGKMMNNRRNCETFPTFPNIFSMTNPIVGSLSWGIGNLWVIYRVALGTIVG
jgi:hypothetical protein